MTKMPQFALKVDGETVLRSDDAETILKEMARRLEPDQPLPIISEPVSLNSCLFSDVVYVAGQIVDWIYHEIPSVKRTEMHLEGPNKNNGPFRYPVRNVVVRVEGGRLTVLRERLENELDVRMFMYHDVMFELLELVHNGTPSLLLQIIQRPNLPLVEHGLHTSSIPFVLRESIAEELRKTSNHTYMKTIIQRILNRPCRCEQIRLGINLVELVLTQDDLSANELVAAEKCLEFLSDTREGKSLLHMWKKRETIKSRWKKRDLASRSFISQVYEWFGDIRTRECGDLSQSYRELSAIDEQEDPVRSIESRHS